MCAKYTAKTEMIPGLEIEQIVLELSLIHIFRRFLALLGMT